MSAPAVIGIRGLSFEEAEGYFVSKGLKAVLVDPSCVCGRDHALSAVMHAERAFSGGRNRSRDMSSEVILYLLCERQVAKALKRARPGDNGMVAIVLDAEGRDFPDLGGERDDSLFAPSAGKALAVGAELSCGIRPEDAVLEAVASVDLMKQR